MTGADRLRWLNGLVTCNVETPLPEHYGLLCEKKGKIETDFHFVDSGSALLVALPSEKLDAIYTVLDHHLIMEDVEITKTDLVVSWHFASPDGGNLPGSAIAVKAPIHGLGDAASLDATMIVGEDFVRGEGEALSDEEWNALRVFSRVPAYGIDFDATMYPQEASIEKHSVAFDKGCYMGQEVVFMMQNRGHARRRLVALAFDGAHSFAKGDEVKTEAGETFGTITSSAKTDDATYAIALVASKLITKDANYTLSEAKGRIVGSP